jgi:hypothetical protein
MMNRLQIEWLEDHGSVPSLDRHFVFSPLCPELLWSLLSPLSNGHWGLCPMVKQLGYKADHSHQFNVKVKNAWSSASTPSCVFMALIKQRDYFSLLISILESFTLWDIMLCSLWKVRTQPTIIILLSFLAYLLTLKMEVTCSSLMLVDF